MRAAALHYRADLSGHELIIAITKFLGLRALTGSNAQHQIEKSPAPYLQLLRHQECRRN